MGTSKENATALWDVFEYTSVLLKKMRQRELNQFDISLRTSSVLRTILILGEPATVADLAWQLGLESHSIAAQLSRMEKEGLIEKTKNPEKRNLIHIRITEKGYEKLKKIHERKSVELVMSVLSDEEQQRFWEILIKIREQAIIEVGKTEYDINRMCLPANLKDYTP